MTKRTNNNWLTEKLGALPVENDDYFNIWTGQSGMTQEEFRKLGDPEPGTDPTWDSLTEGEKSYFRGRRQQILSATDPLKNGRTLSDVLKDREAIEVPVREVKELPGE